MRTWNFTRVDLAARSGRLSLLVIVEVAKLHQFEVFVSSIQPLMLGIGAHVDEVPLPKVLVMLLAIFLPPHGPVTCKDVKEDIVVGHVDMPGFTALWSDSLDSNIDSFIW